jgi:hypothetical protein
MAATQPTTGATTRHQHKTGRRRKVKMSDLVLMPNIGSNAQGILLTAATRPHLYFEQLTFHSFSIQRPLIFDPRIHFYVWLCLVSCLDEFRVGERLLVGKTNNQY